MKKRMLVLVAAFCAGISSAQVKYVAVTEPEIDEQVAAAKILNAAEVQEITATVRREAVRNLPKDKYVIMTAAPDAAQGGPAADYVVRGMIRKISTQLSLSIEMHETKDGLLVESSDPVRSEHIGELLDKTSAAAGDMFRKFAAPAQSAMQRPPAAYPVPPQPGQPIPPQDAYAPQADAQPDAAPAPGGPDPLASLTGDARAVVDKVVNAVNAFKDATTKSIDAANAVKTAAQSKNFSAIMDAKKKVEAAATALKKAKTDVNTAIEALRNAGPEAEDAVKALGINLAMFGGGSGSGGGKSGGGGGGGGGGGEGNEKDGDDDGASANHGTWNKFPPNAAGKGEVKIGIAFGSEQGAFGRVSKDVSNLELNAAFRYSITEGLEASALLPFPTAIFVKDCESCGEDYAGLSYPEIGIRYWLPIGLGFFWNARLPIDTREGAGDYAAMNLDMGLQFSAKFADALALGSQIRFSLPSENKYKSRAPLSLGLGAELDAKLGPITPYIGFDVNFDLTGPAYYGEEYPEYKREPVYDLSFGLVSTINEHAGAHVSFKFSFSDDYKIYNYYYDSITEESIVPMTVGVHLFFNF